MTVIRISGLGLLTSYGPGLAPTVEGLRAGRDGITPLTFFTLPFQDQIKVNQFDHAPFPPGSAGMTAAMHVVAGQAISAAQWPQDDRRRDTALLLGTSSFLFAGESDYRLNLAATGQPIMPPVTSPARLALDLARQQGFHGPVLTLTTACSSSANALTVAANMLRRGEAQRALVIGVEGLSAGALTGFHSMLLLDREGCRPFDAARRGMQIGEAIGAIALEALPEAGDGDYFLGGANLCDTHHMTSASPDGSAMRAVMEQALAQAGLAAPDIAVVKAHGTGSQDNDAAESAAMRALFGERLPPFTSLKRYLGHTLGACGVVELAAFLGCLRAGFVPPTLGCATPDPALKIAPLSAAMPAPCGASMLNYFGFGGNYASLILRHG
jgi:3-oxoacyl-(acyl-carrier-protein) synthase